MRAFGVFGRVAASGGDFHVKQELIEMRVAAYEQAVSMGAPRYGTRGKRGEGSAVLAAARAVGVTGSEPIVAALAAAAHADWLAVQRLRAERAEREKRQAAERARVSAVRGAGHAGRSGDLDGRTRDHIARLAQAQAGRKAQRAPKGADKLVKQRVEIDGAVTRLAREAQRVTLGRGALADALALDRVRAMPRGHALALMRARNQIDAEQFLTACEFRALFELSSASPISAIDFTRDQVDGGKVVFDPVFAPIVGRAELQRVLQRLGETGYTFLVLVAVQGCGLLEAARRIGVSAFAAARKRDEQVYACQRFREICSELRAVMPTAQMAAPRESELMRSSA